MPMSGRSARGVRQLEGDIVAAALRYKRAKLEADIQYVLEESGETEMQNSGELYEEAAKQEQELFRLLDELVPSQSTAPAEPNAGARSAGKGGEAKRG